MASQPHEGVHVEEDPDLVPVCPHCDTPLAVIRARAAAGTGRAPFGFGKRYVYACPGCKKLLGVSHRKGFWMG
ncbi:MAG: hypothetical protein ACLFWM_14085 [Actinomycetota bacterium]